MPDAATTGLIKYDAMCRAIADAYAVDEVKEIRDKALAIERYAAQALNIDAERKACEIRLRAERKAGELLKQMGESGERATRGDADGSNLPNVERHDISSPPTLSDLGISRDQSSKWQRLVEAPAGRPQGPLSAYLRRGIYSHRRTQKTRHRGGLKYAAS